jgi:hypothetical protein
LSTILRDLPSTRETTHVQHPMMARIVSLDALIGALSGPWSALARTTPGPPFTLVITAPGGQSRTLNVRAASLRAIRGRATYSLNEAATFDAIFGQRCASDLVRPRPPAEVRRRIDALLPETALHFWNSDRI